MSQHIGAFLDAASGERVSSAVREAFLGALEAGWADPRRLYREGRQARLLLDAARESVAGSLAARPDEIFFTSSGTAAIHTAILGAFHRSPAGSRIVASAVEHSAVLRCADTLEGRGHVVAEVGVDRTGAVDPAEFISIASQTGTRLACLQSANHEVGALQPLVEVIPALADRGIPVLVDAAQSLGRLPVPDGWSMLAGSAHKWGGLPGVGVLAMRDPEWRSPFPADEGERGRSPGFPSIPAIAASALALEEAVAGMADRQRRQEAQRDRLRAGISSRIPDAVLLGPTDGGLPHLVSAGFLYVDGEALVLELDRRGFAVSSGSACSSDTRRPSHILTAMGVLAHGNVRIGLARDTTDEQVDAFLDALVASVASVREQLGAAGI